MQKPVAQCYVSLRFSNSASIDANENLAPTTASSASDVVQQGCETLLKVGVPVSNPTFRQGYEWIGRQRQLSRAACHQSSHVNVQ